MIIMSRPERGLWLTIQKLNPAYLWPLRVTDPYDVARDKPTDVLWWVQMEEECRYLAKKLRGQDER